MTDLTENKYYYIYNNKYNLKAFICNDCECLSSCFMMDHTQPFKLQNDGVYRCPYCILKIKIKSKINKI